MDESRQEQEARLRGIYRQKDGLLDELLDMTRRVVRMLDKANVDDLEARGAAELIRSRGQVLWTLDQLEKEAAPLRLTFGDVFQPEYDKHMERLAKVYETVIELDRAQYSAIHKHMNTLKKHIRETQNARKMEQMYQNNNPYNQDNQGESTFLDILK
jgi:flagellar biosynthesis/type III secretory pathway chaperone